MWALLRVGAKAGPDTWMDMYTAGGDGVVDYVVAAKMVGGVTLEYLMLMAAILVLVFTYIRRAGTEDLL